jgi:hypothetical protein
MRTLYLNSKSLKRKKSKRIIIIIIIYLFGTRNLGIGEVGFEVCPEIMMYVIE